MRSNAIRLGAIVCAMAGGVAMSFIAGAQSTPSTPPLAPAIATTPGPAATPAPATTPRPPPPTRPIDGPLAPKWTVIAGSGKNPPADQDGNFVIGPEYLPAPELQVIAGVPMGLVKQFVMTCGIL